jgi:hypothetical protein
VSRVLNLRAAQRTGSSCLPVGAAKEQSCHSSPAAATAPVFSTGPAGESIVLFALVGRLVARAVGQIPNGRTPQVSRAIVRVRVALAQARRRWRRGCAEASWQRAFGPWWQNDRWTPSRSGALGSRGGAHRRIGCSPTGARLCARKAGWSQACAEADSGCRTWSRWLPCYGRRAIYGPALMSGWCPSARGITRDELNG